MEEGKAEVEFPRDSLAGSMETRAQRSRGVQRTMGSGEGVWEQANSHYSIAP